MNRLLETQHPLLEGEGAGGEVEPVAIKTIDSSKCQVCPMRQTTGCVVYDICPMDVYRLDEEGKPYIAYVRDCQSCFLCVRDCPQQAVYVTALVDFPILPY